MGMQTQYHYLVECQDKGAPELSMRDTGVRVSTIWYDRYVSQMHPRATAEDRDLLVAAVYEALAYCQEQRPARSGPFALCCRP